jgi:tripartite-type tricarboxylate transporter receptor subunit TctC
MPRLYSFGMALAALIVACTSARAQDAAKYPEQMVRLVVPFSAGSMTDLLARTVAEKLGERWKQQVIVENRPGLAGTSSVAKATPDDYTLMLTSNGHTVIGSLNKNL